jgi:hypothetical protein
MISLVRTMGNANTQPGDASVVLTLDRVSVLVPIIIQVAIPGPA